MKKTSLSFLFLFFTFYTLFAQVSVSGKVSDEKGQPIGYASIALIGARDSQLVKGALSDENGLFSIPAVPVGAYRLMTTMVGYEKKYT